MNLNLYQQEPIKTADGRVWAQNCYVCNGQVDFLKDPSGHKWIRVDTLVRHRKCYPGMPKMLTQEEAA